MADERHEVWFESSARLGASADLALAATLVPAMASAERATVAGELDPRLREHLADIQGIVGSWRNDSGLSPRPAGNGAGARARAAAGPPDPAAAVLPARPRRLSSAAGSTRSTSSSQPPR